MELRSIQHSTVSAKGLAVIPKAVREHLGLQQGDRVAFVTIGGAVWLQPAAPAAQKESLARALGMLAPARIDVLAEKRAELAAEEHGLPPPLRRQRPVLSAADESVSYDAGPREPS